MIKIFTAALSILLMPAFAFATLINVAEGSYQVEYSESFESFAANQYHQGEHEILDGWGSVKGHLEDADDEFFIAKNGRWVGWSKQDTIEDFQANDGVQFLATHNEHYVTFNFYSDVYYFGGYFGDVASAEQDNILFEFFDELGMLIDAIQMDFQTTNGELIWAGFKTDYLLSRVQISGFQSVVDNIQVGALPMASVSEPHTILLLLPALFMFMRRNKT